MFCVPSYFRSGATDAPLPFWIRYLNEQGSRYVQVLLEAHVISLITDGMKHLVYPNVAATTGQEAFMVMKAGKCLMAEQLSEQNRYGSCLFFFDSAFLAEFLAKNNLVLPTHIAPESCIVYPKTPAIRALMESLAHVPTGSVADSPLVRLKTEELLHYIVSAYGVEALAFLLATPTEAADVAFRRVVERHAAQKLSLEELAFLCNMSLSTFKRHFEKTYHMPPSKWLLDQRLAHAARQLRYQHARPSDLYLAYGFESLSSFIQAFKRKFGTTPKQFQSGEGDGDSSRFGLRG